MKPWVLQAIISSASMPSPHYFIITFYEIIRSFACFPTERARTGNTWKPHKIL